MSAIQFARGIYQKKFGLKAWKPNWYIADDGVMTGSSRLAWQAQKDATRATTQLLQRLGAKR